MAFKQAFQVCMLSQYFNPSQHSFWCLMCQAWQFLNASKLHTHSQVYVVWFCGVVLATTNDDFLRLLIFIFQTVFDFSPYNYQQRRH